MELLFLREENNESKKSRPADKDKPLTTNAILYTEYMISLRNSFHPDININHPNTNKDVS